MNDRPASIKKAYVIGWPIEHSRSPMIHSYWLDHYNISGSYEKQAVEPAKFDIFIQSMLNSESLQGADQRPEEMLIAGANITVPYKERAFQLADIVDPMASAVQAANTLWIEKGKLFASNTDIYGFSANLDNSISDWARTDSPVAVLGAGGAARGIIYGLLERGFDEIRLFNRTHSRAENLAGYFGSQIRVVDWERRSLDISNCSLLVNTTSLGMENQPGLEMNLDQLPNFAVVTDLVYVPLKTSLLQQAESRQLSTVDGLGMLLHQAVPGFEKWFGQRPTVTSELRGLVISDLEQSQC